MEEEIEVKILKRRIILIIICIICILLLSNLFIKDSYSAENTYNTNITLANKLWDSKYNNLQIYCTDRDTPFEGGTQNVTITKKTIDSNSNETDIATAYVLNSGDTVWSSEKMKNESKNARSHYTAKSGHGYSDSEAEAVFYNGIYKITSIKQNALWAIRQGDGSSEKDKFINGSAWESDKSIQWERNSGTNKIEFYLDGKDYKFKIKSKTNGIICSTDDCGVKIDKLEESDINNTYYDKAFNLYKEAVNFAETYSNDSSIAIQNTTTGIPTTSNETSYNKIGPFKVSASSNTVMDTIVNVYEGSDYLGDAITSSSVYFVDNSGNKITKITDLIDESFYLILPKTVNLSNIKISFTGKFYKITGEIYDIKVKNGGQNLVAGNIIKKQESASLDIYYSDSTETPETPTKEQVSIKVKKIWDHQGYTGTKPTQIKINIYRNGILYSQETVDTGSSNTDYIKIEKPFDKCDANDNEYTYTIDEEVITGTNYTYAPESITGGKTADGYEFTITNKYSPPKPTFEKENTDSLPPIKIQINKVLERNR